MVGLVIMGGALNCAIYILDSDLFIYVYSYLPIRMPINILTYLYYLNKSFLFPIYGYQSAINIYLS